ncbi:MAG TPA: enoyl-CoA hydratase-related protein [Candidatus Polarisedimenticolia bacterium]|jgi:enoyl-CoA hydratase|nr:enoyl-CoA hydratase-related protein [Candidatus Polarisedimenticolia bacterium]
MTYQNLLVETRERIARVTVNRAEKLNALSRATLQEMDRAFGSFAADSEVGVVILTGAGSKAFVAGADIQELAQQSPLEGRAYARFGQELFSRIENLGKPVLAAVNGYALGGGCEIALACTLRFAASTAKFGQPEVNLGIIPGYGGTQRLARLVGRGKAQEMILTGEMIDAAEAHRIGLVNQVFAPEELLARTEAIAATILSRGPLAVRYALEAIRRGLNMPLEEGLDFEATLFGVLCASEDMKEGTRAFMEKRKAEFRGR